MEGNSVMKKAVVRRGLAFLLAFSMGISTNHILSYAGDQADISQFVSDEDVIIEEDTLDPTDEVTTSDEVIDADETITASEELTELEPIEEELTEEDSEKEDSEEVTPIEEAELTEQVLTSGDFKYTVSSGKAVITKYTGSKDFVTIPETLGGYTVTAIGDKAFFGNDKVTTIRMSQTLESFGEYAFASCTSLGDIWLSQGLKSIGDHCFDNCPELNQLTLYENIETVGKNAFPDLRILYLNNLKTIPDNCCKGCSKLRSLQTSTCTELEYIGENAFYGCTSLPELNIPNSVIEIGDNAFYGCSGVTHINGGQKVQRIGENCFYGCEKIFMPYLPQTVTYIGKNAFAKCTGYNNIKIPAGAVVDTGAFSDCPTLDYVTILDNVTLKGNTFKGCGSFKGLHIGENFRMTKTDFDGITYKGTIDGLTWEVEAPSFHNLIITGTGSIPGYSSTSPAPWQSAAPFISQITIKGDVNKIGTGSFSGFEKLKDVVMTGSVQHLDNNAWNGSSVDFIELSPALSKCSGSPFGSPEELIFTGKTAPTISFTYARLDNCTVYYPRSGKGYDTSEWQSASKRTGKFIKYDDSNGGTEIVLVLDTSSKMTQKRMNALKKAATEFTDYVCGPKYNTRISMVTYSDDSYIAEEGTFLKSIPDRRINMQVASGKSNFLSALQNADKVLSKSSCKNKYIVMFSQGSPDDNKKSIYEQADKLRTKYGIYTVGIDVTGTTEGKTRKETLETIAGSEDRYFNASYLLPLIAVFRKDIEVTPAPDDPETEPTKVEIHRGTPWYDGLNTTAKYVTGSEEVIAIRVTPSKELGSVAKYVVGQHGYRSNLFEDTNRTFSIIPGKLFKENYNREKNTINSNKGIYINLLDSKGNVLETLDLKMAITDAFRVTYKKNDGTDTVVYTQLVKPWEDFKYDAVTPIRGGYKFAGWYDMENPTTKQDFFHEKNKAKRYYIEDDITLYAAWEKTGFDFDTHTWGFTNSSTAFCSPYELDYIIDGANPFGYLYKYDILNEDFKILLANNNNADKAAFKEARDERWTGSCFGMSATAVLCSQNVIDTESFKKNRPNPRSVSIKDDMPYKLTGKFESLINYYQILKWNRTLRAIINNASAEHTKAAEASNIEAALQKMKQNYEPVVLCVLIYKGDSDENRAAHAIVAYDLQEVSPDTYNLSIYDCNYNEKPYLAVISKDSDGYFTCDFSELEKEYGSSADIFFGSVTTAEEILTSSAGLTSPGTIDPYGVKESDKTAAATYRLNTSYSSFTISSGKDSATIRYGKKTAGKLKISCKGTVNQWGENPEYEFELPKLAENKSYTISPDSVSPDLYITTLHYSFGAAGFHSSVKAQLPGKITIKCGGNVETSFDEDTKQQLFVTSNAVSMPWYSLYVTATDKAVSTENYSDRFHVSTATPGKTAEITVEGDINKTTFDALTIPEGGIDLKENDGSCAVISSDNKPVDSKDYGYCVIFNSQGGSVVDTLMNVRSGETIKAPTSPEKDDLYFAGWFKDEACSLRWNFAKDVVEADTTLYAGWSTQKNLSRTVSFNTGTKTVISPVTTDVGSTITKPSDPKRSGYVFCGWFKDEQFSDEWDFEKDAVVKDITLFAKWAQTHVDKNGADTGISIEILRPESYYYTGKAVTPSIIVRDGSKVLNAGTDYKLTCKNNVKPCELSEVAANAPRVPKVIVKGMGDYKNSTPLIATFSIHKADMAAMDITVPEYVRVKGKNKLQYAAVTVKNGPSTVKKNLYTVSYYVDEDLTEKVPGITLEGTYYLQLEANSQNGLYTGDYQGKSGIYTITCIGKNATVKGKASLSSSMFDCTGASTYTGRRALPTITTRLIPDQDYTVSYMRGKEAITADQVVDAGKYSIVITGINRYKGKVTLPYTITKADLASAFAANKLKVSVDNSAAYSPIGGIPKVSVLYDSKPLTEGKDYKVTYCNNKKVTSGKYAYIKITGRGNFAGTVSGNDKTGDLNYSVTQKNIGDKGIYVNLAKCSMKAGKPSSVSVKLTQDEKVIPASEYSYALSEAESNQYSLTITAKGKNYTGTRIVLLPGDLTAITDTEKVSIKLADSNKIYFTGEQITPKIVITDSEGKDISDSVFITYDNNTSVGTGKVTITGDPEKGYYGSKTLEFRILPKWMKWIW